MVINLCFVCLLEYGIYTLFHLALEYHNIVLSCHQVENRFWRWINKRNRYSNRYRVLVKMPKNKYIIHIFCCFNQSSAYKVQQWALFYYIAHWRTYIQRLWFQLTKMVEKDSRPDFCSTWSNIGVKSVKISTAERGDELLIEEGVGGAKLEYSESK